MRSDRCDVLRTARMIKGWRKAVRTAAVALIHAYHVHSGSHAFCSNPDHVLGIAGAFKAMNDQHRQGISSIWLPMAMTKDANSRLNLYKPLFGARELESPWQKEAGEGLHMAATKSPMRNEV